MDMEHQPKVMFCFNIFGIDKKYLDVISDRNPKKTVFILLILK